MPTPPQTQLSQNPDPPKNTSIDVHISVIHSGYKVENPYTHQLMKG